MKLKFGGERGFMRAVFVKRAADVNERIWKMQCKSAGQNTQGQHS